MLNKKTKNKKNKFTIDIQINKCEYNRRKGNTTLLEKR